jgi:glutathione synthase/RimK-type ligase-like ATP-grasp enzyme
MSTTPASQLTGIAPLMRQAFMGVDLRPLGAELLARAHAHPDDANALFDLSTVLHLTGDREAALAVQMEAISINPLYTIPAKMPARLRVLAIMGPGDLRSNTPVEFLLDDADVTLDMLYLTLDTQWPDTVPDHDVLLVAIAGSEANRDLLALVAQLVADWPRPVLNRPERIAALSRDDVCTALEGVAGMLLPPTIRTDRGSLGALAAGDIHVQELLPGDAFPLIVRPVGSHAGTDLDKVADAAALRAYLDRVGADAFYLSRFIDYSGADGLFRNYRVVLIAGVPYTCHCAVSTHWMIHDLNAGMTASWTKREHEEACVLHCDDAFATRHRAALAEIDQRIGLDYAGIDCAETANGNCSFSRSTTRSSCMGWTRPTSSATSSRSCTRYVRAFARCWKAYGAIRGRLDGGCWNPLASTPPGRRRPAPCHW